jgi:hypothetical protein
MTYPIILLSIFGVLLNKKFWKENLVLIVWFAAPFFAAALVGRTLYPRYELPMVLTLLPIIAYIFYWIFLKFKHKVYFFTKLNISRVNIINGFV